MPETLLLPLVVWRGTRVFPFNGRDALQEGDVVHMAISTDRREEARAWLVDRGWQAAYVEEGELVLA